MKKIVIFNPNLSVGALLVVGQDGFEVKTIGNFDPRILDGLQQFLKRNNPRLGQASIAGSIHSIGLREVVKTDPQYIDAIMSELQVRGFLANKIDEVLEPLLLQLSSESISVEQRKDLLGDILNLSDDDAAGLAGAAESVSLILEKIAKNRQEWEDELKTKADEFLKNKGLG